MWKLASFYGMVHCLKMELSLGLGAMANLLFPCKCISCYRGETLQMQTLPQDLLDERRHREASDRPFPGASVQMWRVWEDVQTRVTCEGTFQSPQLDAPVSL